MKSSTLASLAAFVWMMSSCTHEVVYLDNDYPELTPKKYAPGIINREGRFQQNMTMTSDGSEHLLTVTDAEMWRYERILRVRDIGGEKAIDTPQFVTNFQYENVQFIGEPMIAPDNQRLFFIADYPPNLWTATRTATGDWSAPTKMSALSTDKADWYVTLAKNNNLYFANGTAYQATPENDQYVSKSPIEDFLGLDVRDPCISPAEDYMILTLPDTLNNDQTDLFVSFKNDQGQWSDPKKLGYDINTEYWEFAPYISPDEEYLFFSRREKWQQAKFSHIYWVKLAVIDEFREG